jgi:anti-anti-sigma regulatory factor
MIPTLIDKLAELVLTPVLVLRPAVEPAGSVLTSIELGRAVVWLRGEIDLALAPDLTELARHARDLAPHIVLEVSRMTFCDVTLINFIAVISQQVAVTVRRPPRLLVDLLEICGLTGRVQVAHFPGPAPALPA